jgi:fibronectin type 3 domain-containing protein
LNANQSATLTVTFSPISAGSIAGSVVLSSNAGNSSIVIVLAGVGVQPATHSVTLNWSPSSSDVIGYYIYRGGSSDGPWTRLIASTETALSYTDTTVQAGQLYFYAVSSVGSDDLESALSGTVSAQIPSP